MATAAARTHAILKLKAGGRTRLIVFDTQDLSLGRAKENDISIDDAEMSRKHAVLKRSREGCTVEDMGTSNGTAVNGQTVQRAVLKHGDVVKIGEVEITYAETTRAPSSLGPVEYASQLKSFGTPMPRVKDGEATILGGLDALTSDDEDDFEVRPAGEFDFDLHANPGKSAPRDLDAEVASLDIDSEFTFGSAPTQAPPLKPPAPRAAAAPAQPRKPAAPALPPKQEVWELDEAPAKATRAAVPGAGPLALTLEIDGLSGELRRAVEALLGKVIEVPSLRVKIKGRDLA